jgi:hypothetical protein
MQGKLRKIFNWTVARVSRIEYDLYYYYYYYYHYYYYYYYYYYYLSSLVDGCDGYCPVECDAV